MLADVICYWKMTSFMTLDVVTSFLCLKGITNTYKHMQYMRLFLLLLLESNRSALMHELLHYNSLSVSCTKINHSRCPLVI